MIGGNVLGMESSIVDLRGKQSFLEIHFDTNQDFHSLRDAMIHKLESGGNFFMGAQCVHVIAQFNAEEEKEINDLLTNRFCFAEVVFLPAQNATLLRPAESTLHVENRKNNENTARIKKRNPFAENLDYLPQSLVELFPEKQTQMHKQYENAVEKNTLVIQSTVRNGQRIEYDGDITLFGDVNIGAELVATGNITVLGVLRGKVHAGSAGDEKAIIVALQLLAQQLRISEYIAIAPKIQKKMPFPEKAVVQGSSIVLLPVLKKTTKKR